MDIHVHITKVDDVKVQEILNRIKNIQAKGDTFMASVKEVLTAIDAKTNEIGASVTSVKTSNTEIKALVQVLKDNQSDPELQAQAEAILEKLNAQEADLEAAATELGKVGKTDPTIPVDPTPPSFSSGRR